MRLFIAIELADAVKGKLSEAIGRFKSVAPTVKWCEPHQLHLTMAFLGEVSPAFLPHLKSALENFCATGRPFDISVYGLGYFGTKRAPRSVWAGVTPTPELMEAQERVVKELLRFGLKEMTRDFRPHVTLGRIRDAGRQDELITAMQEEVTIDFGQWQAGGLTLFESTLTPKGSRYRVLLRAPFTAAE